MNTEKSNNKPLHTIRDGSLKATIWKNAAENGEFCSVRLSRTWTDAEGKYHDADTFSGAELLRVSRLANLAYDEILVQRMNDRAPDL